MYEQREIAKDPYYWIYCTCCNKLIKRHEVYYLNKTTTPAIRVCRDCFLKEARKNEKITQ